MDKDWIKKIRLFLFDMDGTLYLGDRLFDSVIELLSLIKSQKKQYLFLTNNSSKSVADYIKKLEKLGIPATENEFITSAQATAIHLKEHFHDKTFYVCGTASLKEEFSLQGLSMTEDLNQVEAIVVGNDTELTFQKLDDICRLLSTKDLPYLATNPDLVCPTEYGSVPDCGSICQIIETATGKAPIFIGKPEPAMALLAMELTGHLPEETAVVGDRIYTDIKCGLNAKCHTILVMSGETTQEILAASPDQPEVVLESVTEILQVLKEV